MMPGQITDPKTALSFMFAGNATVTFRSLKTGERRTYKIREAEKRNPNDANEQPVYFVKLLNGPDNESAYVYMGMVRDGKFSTTRASKMDTNSVAVKAFTWVLEYLQKNVLPESLEIWHEGRCGRCGRKLTVPESIASGFGPECARFIVELTTNPVVANTPLDEKRVKTPKAPVQTELPLAPVAVANANDLDDVPELN